MRKDELGEALALADGWAKEYTDGTIPLVAQALLHQTAELEKMREALRFYADEKHYWESIKDGFRTTETQHDRGATARQALQESQDDGK